MLKDNNKIINIFCDGTWQTDEQEIPTNVTKLYRAARDTGPENRPQKNFYIDGIGTKGTALRRIIQGAFAYDIETLVKSGYRVIAENYTPGDTINLIGFSRGSTIARMLAGMIDTSGIIDPEKIPEGYLEDIINNAWDLYRKTGKFRHYRHLDYNAFKVETALFRSNHCHNDKDGSYESSPHINKMLLFDTVGSLGVPSKYYIFERLENIFGIPEKYSLSDKFFKAVAPRLHRDYYRFFDNNIPSIVDEVTHFIASEETRDTFKLADIKNNLWNSTRIKNIYCRGNHSAVGGGDKQTLGLSDHIGLLGARETQNSIGFDQEKLAEQFVDAEPESALYTTEEFAEFNKGILNFFSDKHFRKPPPSLFDGNDEPYNVRTEIDSEAIKAMYRRTGILPRNFDKNPKLESEAWDVMITPKVEKVETAFQGFDPALLQKSPS